MYHIFEFANVVSKHMQHLENSRQHYDRNIILSAIIIVDSS